MAHPVGAITGFSAADHFPRNPLAIGEQMVACHDCIQRVASGIVTHTGTMRRKRPIHAMMEEAKPGAAGQPCGTEQGTSLSSSAR